LENQNFALQRQVDRLTKDNRALDVARAELQSELEQAQEQINREKYNLQSEQVRLLANRYVAVRVIGTGYQWSKVPTV